MCGYRIWGLAAAFIGYLLTGFFLSFFGINLDPDDEKTIGFIVGLVIYFAPLILSNYIEKRSSASTPNIPSLSESDVEKIKPFAPELLQRINAGEKMEVVAQSIATRAGVTPGHVVVFTVALAQALKEKKD